MKNIVYLLIIALLLGGCGNQSNEAQMRLPDPDEIVPSRQTLIDNLSEAGYIVSELNTTPVSSICADRIFAEKDGSFIDITYGLNADETQAVFDDYAAKYKDYYILAINGNYVYCIGDKGAFSKAGFTTTANVGVQYIRN